MSESHLCYDCFFNEMHSTPQKVVDHCSLFVKYVTPELTSCINHATAQDVAETIITNKAFSKDVKVDLLNRIITKKLEREHLMAISQAVLQTSEIKDFGKKFEKFCELKIQELDNGDKLIGRKPTSGQIEPGWDKSRIYKETRIDKEGTPYVRMYKISMATNGLTNCEILEDICESQQSSSKKGGNIKI